MYVAKHDGGFQNPYLMQNPFAVGLVWGPKKKDAKQFETAKEAIEVGQASMPSEDLKLAVVAEEA